MRGRIGMGWGWVLLKIIWLSWLQVSCLVFDVVVGVVVVLVVVVIVVVVVVAAADAVVVVIVAAADY